MLMKKLACMIHSVRFTAVLDTNVVYPVIIRDLLSLFCQILKYSNFLTKRLSGGCFDNDLVRSIYIEILSADLGVGGNRMTVNANGDKHASERELQALYTVFHDGVPNVSMPGERVHEYFVDRIEGAYDKVGRMKNLHAIPEVKAQLQWAFEFLKNH